ncbi:MAG: hypothetical protein JWM88_1382 [Verrucomicrobia bacterium]|nr:hypothetical protein [Verrucomicrobiota bacterium]
MAGWTIFPPWSPFGEATLFRFLVRVAEVPFFMLCLYSVGSDAQGWALQRFVKAQR